jgi:hypothetical protein
MMAVNKPVGDNARKDAEEAHPAQDKARRRDGLDQAQQDLRRVHGGEKARQVQGRAAGEGQQKEVTDCLGPVVI